ncbi:hypothetical protein ACEQ8H_001198 [Pleosporales sp. CAS-2024a]
MSGIGKTNVNASSPYTTTLVVQLRDGTLSTAVDGEMDNNRLDPVERGDIGELAVWSGNRGAADDSVMGSPVSLGPDVGPGHICDDQATGTDDMIGVYSVETVMTDPGTVT